MSDAMDAAIGGLLLAVNLLSSTACYGLRGFSRSRLDEICRDHDKSQRFSVILKRHEETLVVTEFVYAVTTITLAWLSASWLDITTVPTHAVATAWIAFSAQWGLVVVALLFLAIILPRSIARTSGEHFLFHCWPLLTALQAALRPVEFVASGFDTFLHRVIGREQPEEGDVATLTEEIRTVVDEGQRGGILESDTRTMIHRIMELGEGDAAAVMTPRTDMFWLNVDASFEEARRQLVEAGHTRVPVVDRSTDDIVGILYAKDLLNYTQQNAPPLSEIVREPFYVPETTRIDALLETMKRKHVHLAIVLDEYGGVAGLVTLEDILEEIVGEIADEYDSAEAEPIRRLSPEVAEIDARVHIDDLNETLDCDLPENQDYDTVGGFVFAALGRIPETGDTLTANGLRFTVLEADKRKIIKLRIESDDATPPSVNNAATASD